MNDVHITSRRTYFFVYLALLLLLGTTIGAAYLPLGPFHTPLALAIAVTKALLVILFFMQMRYSSGLVRLFFTAGFLWLAILIALTLADYLTRASAMPFMR